MTDHLLTRLHTALANSTLLSAVASVRVDGGRKLGLDDVTVRPLTDGEIDWLERQGNSAEDWSRVLVAEGFHPGRVRNSEFRGDVILGRFTGTMIAAGRQLPAGIYNSTVIDAIVGHGALIRDVRLLANYVVGPDAILLDCGQVTCDPGTTFGNGVTLPVGVETGGRAVCGWAELDLELATAVARSGENTALRERYTAAVGTYLTRVASPRGIIERGARILCVPQVRNVYVGPSAVVDGATLVADSTLLSSEDEPARIESGALVKGSLLQWGSSARTMALVESSLLTEHAHVERQGKVSGSILGPNTVVGSGEVISCLLGPFVAAHHQSLLIATLWPEGRGNVGYGANVGSNHTSRAPDQEFHAGEGMFFGLGVNVKFPADFSASPYTVVACGASLLPQRVAFPFALIATPSVTAPDLSPAYMEIIPGWGLSDNLYGLRRNQTKYRSRNRARRLCFDFDVLRPEIMDLMRDACQRLEEIRQVQDVYTEVDIVGLGKNFLQEKHRQRAVEVYRFFIRYAALLKLKAWVQNVGSGNVVECSRLLTVPALDPHWEYQRQILVEELGVRDVGEALEELHAHLERVAREVEESKARDDRRGARIHDDYTLVHTPAGQDELVQQTWAETRRLQAEIEEVLTRWHRPLERRPRHHEGPHRVTRTHAVA
jgi:hypothetical protein